MKPVRKGRTRGRAVELRAAVAAALALASALSSADALAQSAPSQAAAQGTVATVALAQAQLWQEWYALAVLSQLAADPNVKPAEVEAARQAWLTNGATVLSVPTAGSAASYFTRGADVMSVQPPVGEPPATASVGGARAGDAALAPVTALSAPMAAEDAGNEQTAASSATDEGGARGAVPLTTEAADGSAALRIAGTGNGTGAVTPNGPSTSGGSGASPAARAPSSLYTVPDESPAAKHAEPPNERAGLAVIAAIAFAAFAGVLTLAWRWKRRAASV